MKNNKIRKFRGRTPKITFRQMRAMIREIEAEIRAAEEAKNTPPSDTAIPYHEASDSLAGTEQMSGDFNTPPAVVGLDDSIHTHGAYWRN